MVLMSERLVLRKFEKKDINVLYDYRNNEKCSRYQRWRNTSRDYLVDLIQIEGLKSLVDESLQLAIADKNNDDLVGDVFIAFKDKCITIGYTIDFRHHRKGYAYEILNELIDYLFENFKGYEIVGMVHPDNTASRRLLEKLDFKSEGYVEKIDSVVYCLEERV